VQGPSWPPISFRSQDEPPLSKNVPSIRLLERRNFSCTWSRRISCLCLCGPPFQYDVENSFILSDNISKKGDITSTSGGSADVWKGHRNGERVRITEFQVYEAHADHPTQVNILIDRNCHLQSTVTHRYQSGYRNPHGEERHPRIRASRSSGRHTPLVSRAEARNHCPGTHRGKTLLRR